MDVYIVTGASKGIGQELVRQLRMKPNTVVYGIARTNPDDDKLFVRLDLSNVASIVQPFMNLLETVQKDATSIALINNAGIVDPIGLAGQNEAGDIVQAMNINVSSPIVLTNIFIDKLRTFTGKKKIMMISSGAGRNAYEGWSTYCTTKAALDHFTKVVALEQNQMENPVEVVSIAPGIIDTNMQQTIRSSSVEQFPLVQQFHDYKERGALSTPEQTASKLIHFLLEKDFQKTGPIADIRDVQ